MKARTRLRCTMVVWRFASSSVSAAVTFTAAMQYGSGWFSDGW